MGAIASHRKEEPYRLWSLLEIMKRFSVGTYLTLSHVIGVVSHPSYLDLPSGPPFTQTELEGIRSAFTPFKEQCELLGLKASRATLSALLAQCELGTGMKKEEFYRLLAELQGRLRDEMIETVFLGLNPVETRMYTEWFDKWEPVIDRFPGAAIDIEEASKCWALARYSASVFHSVSIVECGLIELGSFIRVVDPLSGWTAVSKALSNIISKKHGDRTPFEQSNFAFIEQLQGTVEALKNAWRNKISHAQGRLIVLPGSFTAEIAEEILVATRSFMRRLALGLPSS